ncbi:MAG: hypothetical protein L0H93_23525 [Nocardioides sp.]|nr:hypothetical protein [Nocardioides sp.]
MNDHIEEAIELVATAHSVAAARMEQATSTAADELTARLLPHSNLSADVLDDVIRAGVDAAASGVLDASMEVLHAMQTALSTLQAHTEARDIPDAPPNDWNL